MSFDKFSAELSEAESDTSSVMGDSCSMDSSMKPPSPASREQLVKRIESLLQENRVLKVELETYKLRVKNLQEENKGLKQTSVLIQAKAEQEEEFISNTLLKKIQELKKEKEQLALNYEQEEECLTNDLSRKLFQLRQEKAELASTLQHEQESFVSKLMRKIKKLEAETHAKQTTLEQLRREKVELENTLEQEQESLVNRLWKRMDKLEAEKRNLQVKLDQPISAPPSPMDVGNGEQADSAALARHIGYLRNEVSKLKQQLHTAQNEHSQRMQKLSREEQQIREENVRLQRKLQMEMERREQLCRHLSESESSLEMEDERHFNELTSHTHGHQSVAAVAGTGSGSQVASCTAGMNAPMRSRAISSPVSSGIGRPISPALGGLNVNVSMGGAVAYSPPSPLSVLTSRCSACGNLLSHSHNPQHVQNLLVTTSPPPAAFSAGGSGNGGAHSLRSNSPLVRTRSTGSSSGYISDKSSQAATSGSSSAASDRFVRPINPPASGSGSMSSPQAVAARSGLAGVADRQLTIPSPVAMLQDDNSNGSELE